MLMLMLGLSAIGNTSMSSSTRFNACFTKSKQRSLLLGVLIHKSCGLDDLDLIPRGFQYLCLLFTVFPWVFRVFQDKAGVQTGLGVQRAGERIAEAVDVCLIVAGVGEKP